MARTCFNLFSAFHRNEYWFEVDHRCKGGQATLDDLSITYGFANQADLRNADSGLQCTSMALTAVIYWFQKDYTSQFVRQDINRILHYGNQIHSALRLMDMAKVNDGMIGLGDLPHTTWLMLTSLLKNVGNNIGVKLASESVPVFTSRTGAQAGLMCLEDYIVSYQPENPHVGFVMTVECYSYAIMRCADAYILFDSHGNLRYMRKYIIKRGMVVRFPNLHSLTGMLQNMYGLCALCDVAPVQCRYYSLTQLVSPSTSSATPPESNAEPAKQEEPQAPEAVETSENTTPAKKSPVGSPEAEYYIDDDYDHDDDCSPYVSFMGGRGD